ncbi:DUF2771 domain-containing protein [Streptomyces sp. TRM43335]|uniref:DUF2771 domain-containing protein n=1 Tax=Streptomyces taklimakanensis TaxID=2569853 RepID=A0A6G2BBT0_9ACTN|nr:DUF2771 domain-containing protein [Streptomyces taklimakanensis]MTE19586.1 DUF2771 domain-containing protein [Streptomyces taklimakanensis]
MTHTISRGKGSRTIRTAVAIGAATLGLVALSACEKPTPRATVTVGSDSVSTEAACYEDGATISQEKVLSCAEEETDTSITVDEGDLLRIGVDPEIAEEGWVLFLDGQPAVTDKIGKTYRSFSGDAFFRDGESKSAQLSIVEYDGSEYHGVWNFELKKASEG